MRLCSPFLPGRGFGGRQERPEHPHGQAGLTRHSWGRESLGRCSRGVQPPSHPTPPAKNPLPGAPPRARGLAASATRPELLASSRGCRCAEDIGAGGVPVALQDGALASPVRSHPHRDPCRAVPGAGRSLCATATSFRKGQNPQEGEFSDLDSPPWPAGLEEQRDEQAPPGAASGCCAHGTGMAPAGGSFSSPGVGRRPFPAVSSAAVPGSG